MNQHALRSLVLLALLFGAGRGTAAPAVRIEVSPSEALMDEIVRITVRGLNPNQAVTIRASQTAADKRRWQSQAFFRADANGVVDVARQTPVSGAYGGVDAMGLFWSMGPDPNQKEGDAGFMHVDDVRQPIVTHLEVESQGRVVAAADLRRRFLPETVRITEIREAGLIGRLYEPAPGQPRPALIVLGGSEGGYEARDAALFAARGYTALSLAYFGMPGLPPELHNVPVEVVKRAIDWMRGCRSVDAARIGVVGGSRGSELALLAAVQFPELRAVVAMKPSNVVWEGLNAKGNPNGASFTFQGKPLPYVPNHISFAFAWSYGTHLFSRTPPALTPMFLDSLADRDAVAKAVIPVERISGPVLLISGKDDQLWPSSLMGDKIMERLKQHGHRFRDQHVSYEGVGHSIPLGYLPLAGSRRGLRFAIGGNPRATAQASPDAWRRILEFLQRELAEGAAR